MDEKLLSPTPSPSTDSGVGSPCSLQVAQEKASAAFLVDQGKSPAVTFIVTSYNKAPYLAAVIEAVWSEVQAVNGEMILFDDGSTDGSAEICEQFASAHPSVIFRRQANVGVYRTLNRAMVMASGEWIRFCDSDDPIVPGSTIRLCAVAEKMHAPAAYGAAVTYGPHPLAAAQILNHRVTCGQAGLHRDGAMYLIKRMGFTPSCAIYRREALKTSFPLPEHLMSCQDLAFSLPAVMQGGIAWVEEPTCFHLVGTSNQLSAHRVLMWHQITRIIQHNEPILDRHHCRAAVVKAAHRALRYQRIRRAGLQSLAMRLWLFALIARAKLGLCDAERALDSIARSYEQELGPLIEGRQRVY